MLNKIGGRKVVFGFIFLAVGVTLSLTLGDLPKNLMEFMIFLSAGFFLGNSVEHSATAISKRGSKEIDQVKHVLSGIQEQSARQAEAVSVTQRAVSEILDKTGIAKK